MSKPVFVRKRRIKTNSQNFFKVAKTNYDIKILSITLLEVKMANYT